MCKCNCFGATILVPIFSVFWQWLSVFLHPVFGVYHSSPWPCLTPLSTVTSHSIFYIWSEPHRRHGSIYKAQVSIINRGRKTPGGKGVNYRCRGHDSRRNRVSFTKASTFRCQSEGREDHQIHLTFYKVLFSNFYFTIILRSMSKHIVRYLSNCGLLKSVVFLVFLNISFRKCSNLSPINCDNSNLGQTGSCNPETRKVCPITFVTGILLFIAGFLLTTFWLVYFFLCVYRVFYRNLYGTLDGIW